MTSVEAKTLTGHRSQATGYFNDLEKIVIIKYPQIAKVKDDLIAAGCSYAQMTGSGSAVFGIVEANGEEALKKLKSKYSNSYLVQNIKAGVEILS